MHMNYKHRRLQYLKDSHHTNKEK